MPERGAATGRRKLLIGGAAAVALSACGRDQEGTPVAATVGTPDAALKRLLAGNKRWVNGKPEHPGQNAERRREVARGQNPFAVVLTCIDSRVGPEIVFDTGAGDLFVVRSAGQTVDRLIAGSVEYGPVERATPLILVMGHQRCGAVRTAWEAHHASKHAPGDLQAIVESLKPAYEEARRAGEEAMIRAQVRLTVRKLSHEKELSPMLRQRRLAVVGAYYSLDTGCVEVLRLRFG